MKKLISIENLEVGMFVEADAGTDNVEGAPVHFLSLRNALCTGSSTKRARLTGHLPERIKQEGGLLIATQRQIQRLKATGLSILTIDTAKGRDLPENLQPLTDPARRPPPAGRLIHFDEEIERAGEIRTQTTDILRTALENLATGKDLELEKLHNAGKLIAESLLRNVDAMVSLTRLKKHDTYTAMHCINVCSLVTAMALHDGMSPNELVTIAMAGLLHDVGKTRVPLEILNKPGRFEPWELQEMRKHALYSGEIMHAIGGFTDKVIAIATQHHEMLDGSGYSLALQGEEIDWCARLTAVADVYDALTSRRVYKPAMPMSQAMLHIVKNKGMTFDERAVELFVKTLGFYPVGSLVELNNRERAVVYEPNPQTPRKPTIGIFCLPNQQLRGAPLIVNLAFRSAAEGRQIVKILDPEREGVDTEQMMQQVRCRGEYTERRRR